MKQTRVVFVNLFHRLLVLSLFCRPSLEPIKEFKSPPSKPPVPKTHSAPEFKSPTTLLTQDLSSTLQVNSPSHNEDTAVKPGVCSTLSLLSSAKKFQSSHNGLNTILDGSPDSPPMLVSHRKIHRPALRVYYGNSVNSPNVGRGLLDAELQQETEKISPRLTGWQQRLRILRGIFSSLICVCSLQY